MKTKLLFITLLLFALSYAQQDSTGTGLRPYSGVYSIKDNPANFLGSMKKWDINLFSTYISVGNNKSEFSISKINNEKILNDILMKEGTFSANVNVDFMWPSFAFNINQKNSIGITTRSRVIVNSVNVDTQLINSIRDVEINQNLFPYRINSDENQIISANAWSEIGANYAIEVFSDSKNTIRVGGTLKYLLGTANSYLNIDKLKGSIDLDVQNNNGNIELKPYLNDAITDLTFVSSGVDIIGKGNFEVSDLTKINGNGIGADLGVVYELKLDENNSSKYKLKAGVSLLDIGSIKYNPEPNNAYSYTANIPADKKFYLSELIGGLSDIQDILKKSPYFKHKDMNGKYSAGLPTSLHLFADYNMISNFYLAASARFNMVDIKKSPQNAFYTNNYNITPRFEAKYYGFYLPINYNEVSSLSLGAGLRLGPVSIMSSSIISALMSKTQQVDLLFGLNFGWE